MRKLGVSFHLLKAVEYAICAFILGLSSQLQIGPYVLCIAALYIAYRATEHFSIWFDLSRYPKRRQEVNNK